MRFSHILITGLIIIAFCGTGFCINYHVDALTGSNDNDGFSWDTPWLTITHALASCEPSSGDPAVIWISDGNYNVALGEAFPLVMQSYIILRGTDMEGVLIDAAGSGEAGILCENISGASIENLTIVNAGVLFGSSRVEQAEHTGSGIYMSESVLEILDVTVSSCFASAGGGIFISNSSPYLLQCTINDNSATIGGGIYVRGESAMPTIASSRISGNYAENDGGGFYFDLSQGAINYCDIENNTAYNSGGGIYCINSQPLFRGCTILENTADNGDDTGTGGGYFGTFSNSYFAGSIFTGNTSDTHGGGIHNIFSSITLEVCILEYNQAQSGGGIYNEHGIVAIEDSQLYSNRAEGVTEGEGIGGGIFNNQAAPLEIRNTLFIDNYATDGAGLFTGHALESTTNIINCTFADNTNENGNTISILEAVTYISDTILWGNNNTEAISSGATVEYSDVQGGYPGEGNFELDPLFTSGPWGAYYLSQESAGQIQTSPCVSS